MTALISRLRPLDVTISFEERTYQLGQPIDLTIQLMPHRDCHVREGRVDLVLEERWTESSTLSVEKPIFLKAGVGFTAQVIEAGSTIETKEVTKALKETAVHSSAVFLEEVRLRSGGSVTHNLRLGIRPEAPAHAENAKTKWWIQTVIDVEGARDIKPRVTVSIAA